MSEKFENQIKISELEKESYKTLIQLCTLPKNHDVLFLFFENLNDYSNSENYDSTFNYVLEYFEEHELFIIMNMDWKQDVKDLEWKLKNSLQKNFDKSIQLPNPSVYGEDASISNDHVFQDYDNALREHGLQIGFIDIDSDEYILFIHNEKDIDEIEIAIQNLDFEYYEQ